MGFLAEAALPTEETESEDPCCHMGIRLILSRGINRPEAYPQSRASQSEFCLVDDKARPEAISRRCLVKSEDIFTYRYTATILRKGVSTHIYMYKFVTRDSEHNCCVLGSFLSQGSSAWVHNRCCKESNFSFSVFIHSSG